MWKHAKVYVFRDMTVLKITLAKNLSFLFILVGRVTFHLVTLHIITHAIITFDIITSLIHFLYSYTSYKLHLLTFTFPYSMFPILKTDYFHLWCLYKSDSCISIASETMEKLRFQRYIGHATL